MKAPVKLESVIQAEIRLAVGALPYVRLFRNNRGEAWMGKPIDQTSDTVTLLHPRRVNFGLFDGASDLIGLTQVVITADMVGRKVALFTAAEVKRPKVKVPTEQQDFVDFVVGFGGIAGVIRSDLEGVALVSTPPGGIIR